METKFENTSDDEAIEVKIEDMINIKEDIDEYVQSKDELLTTECYVLLTRHYDLQTLKNENTEYLDCLAEPFDREQNGRTLTSLKSKNLF